MGWPPAVETDYDVASVIESLGGDLPVTTEAASYIIEKFLGTYVVRGDLHGVVPVTNVSLGAFLHQNLNQAVDDTIEGDAFVGAFLGNGVVRMLTEKVFAEQMVRSEIWPRGERFQTVEAKRLTGRLVIPPGVASDDVVLVSGEEIAAFVEIKASLGGFGYPLRSADKALVQLQNTLAANPLVGEALLVLVAMEGHNAVVIRSPRTWWLSTTPVELRRRLKNVLRESDWPGEPPPPGLTSARRPRGQTRTS